MGKLVVDKIAGPLIHGHREDQISGLEEKYVEVAGDTMTGELNMQTNAIILKDGNGIEWALTIDTSGALITSQVLFDKTIQTEGGDNLLTEAGAYLQFEF